MTRNVHAGKVGTSWDRGKATFSDAGFHILPVRSKLFGLHPATGTGDKEQCSRFAPVGAIEAIHV
jgi:hypothetical protein